MANCAVAQLLLPISAETWTFAGSFDTQQLPGRHQQQKHGDGNLDLMPVNKATTACKQACQRNPTDPIAFPDSHVKQFPRLIRISPPSPNQAGSTAQQPHRMVLKTTVVALAALLHPNQALQLPCGRQDHDWFRQSPGGNHPEAIVRIEFARHICGSTSLQVA